MRSSTNILIVMRSVFHGEKTRQESQYSHVQLKELPRGATVLLLGGSFVAAPFISLRGFDTTLRITDEGMNNVLRTITGRKTMPEIRDRNERRISPGTTHMYLKSVFLQ